jgi:hypothetical protein
MSTMARIRYKKERKNCLDVRELCIKKEGNYIKMAGENV